MIEMIVEGRGLEPMLREMGRSHSIKVIGAHISGRYPGDGNGGKRVTVRVKADTAAEARELLRSYLPPDGNFTIRPALV
jgi:hypothetical protein